MGKLLRHKRLARKHEELGHELAARAEERASTVELEAALDDALGDELLSRALSHARRARAFTGRRAQPREPKESS